VNEKLIVYSAACRALAAARTTNEVRKIRDSAAMLRAYAKQAKNKQLEMDAAEIRIRAERRVGELIAAQKASVGLARPAVGSKVIGSKRVPMKDTRPTLKEAGIDKKLSARGQQLARVPEKKFEKLVTEWRERTEQRGERVRSEILPSKLEVHHSSDTPEHYTPQDFLAVVHDVFGDIPDLDPCSNSHDAPKVAAHQHYTAEDDGLAQPWSGRVFMNPPYGREVGAWIEKLRREWARGDVTELIALLPSRTDTEWFNALTGGTDDAVICFIAGRLTFIGNNDPAPFPSMAVYFGPKHDLFTYHFLQVGSIWQRPASPLEWFVYHERRG
jgi:hypothetical protein